MTLEQFISEITKNYHIEFGDPGKLGNYRINVTKLTDDGRLYTVQCNVTSDLMYELHSAHNITPWRSLHERILEMMSEEMSKPYPRDDDRPPRRLIKYIRNFIRKHEITCSETIHQSDRLNLAAPDFLDECCEIIGYHKDVITEND